jgi:hypothetical protein
VKISRQKIIALSCIFLMQLGLFASTVHATEHPFHVQNELCASFISFGQHDMSVDVIQPEIHFHVFSVETCTEDEQSVHLSFRPAYSSRAPPVS